MNQHKIKELVEALRWNMDSLDYQPILLSMLCYRELSKKKNTILAPAQLFDAVQQLPALALHPVDFRKLDVEVKNV